MELVAFAFGCIGVLFYLFGGFLFFDVSVCIYGTRLCELGKYLASEPNAQVRLPLS